jgi:hypothetical protein
MSQARQAGPEIDKLAIKLADQNNGITTGMNYKSRASIIRKATNDYNGDISKVRDSVRTTVIVPSDKINSVYDELRKDSRLISAKYQIASENDLGYSGVLTNIKTNNGIVGEIQVNTAKMIYAKEPPRDAINILGKETWEKINKATGLEGGLGHKYYEQWRILDPIKDADKRAEIERLSRNYYKIFQ